MKPMKGKGPKKAPTAPKAPGTAKKGKYQSKTGNMECSNAMSVWQKALHAGITPGKQVYEKLAQCRASVRTNKQNAGKVAAGSMKQSAASAVSNRSDRRIATNTATAQARKERLKELVQARASRNISTADRQKAMDTAAKVTGNQTGPSAGLKRLQKVAKPRAAAAPKATPQATTSTPKPRSQPVTPPLSKAAALVTKVRQSGNHAGNRWDAGVNKRMVSAGISARTGPQIPTNVLQARRDAGQTATQAATPAPARSAVLSEADRARINKNRGRDASGNQMSSSTPGGKLAQTRSAAAYRLLKLRREGQRDVAAEVRRRAIASVGRRNDLGTRKIALEMNKVSRADIRDDFKAAKEQREAQALPKPAKAMPSTPKAAFTPLPKRERTYKPFGQSAMGKSNPEGQRRGSAMRKTQVPAIKERLETLRTNRAAAAGAIPISFKKQTPKGFTANLITGVNGNQFPIAVKPVRRDVGIQATSSRGDFRVVQPSSGMIALPNMLKRDQATRAARAMDYLAERASRGGGAAQGLEALRSRPDYYKIVKRWADRQSHSPSAKKGR